MEFPVRGWSLRRADVCSGGGTVGTVGTLCTLGTLGTLGTVPGARFEDKA